MEEWRLPRRAKIGVLSTIVAPPSCRLILKFNLCNNVGQYFISPDEALMRVKLHVG